MSIQNDNPRTILMQENAVTAGLSVKDPSFFLESSLTLADSSCLFPFGVDTLWNLNPHRCRSRISG